MNKPKYPELRQHQELISTTGFLTPLHADSEPRTAILAQGQDEWHNVCQINANAKHPKLLVRVFVWGQQVTIAQIAQQEYINALRIADMALFRFWKYRLRGGVQPPRELFNFSVEQASRDCIAERVHDNLLDDYEKMLVELKVLPTAEELAAKKAESTAPKVVTSLRKQVTGFGQIVEEIRTGILTSSENGKNYFSGLADRIANLEKLLSDIGTQQGEELKRVTKLEDSRLESLEKSFKQFVTIMTAINEKLQKK